jgi:signal peptidase II
MIENRQQDTSYRSQSVDADGSVSTTDQSDAAMTVTTALGAWKFAKTYLRASPVAGDKTSWIPLMGEALRYAIFILILDQVSKKIFTEFPTDVMSASVTPFLNIVQHHNNGAIGNLPIPLPLIIAITLGVLFFIGKAFIDAVRGGNTQAAYALAFIVGGALSNLYDRVILGYVFDWILLFGRSAINFADIAIVIGALWYLVAIKKKEAAEVNDGSA